MHTSQTASSSSLSLTPGIGRVEAFLLEIGFFLFFLPYTMAFNWIYNILRARIIERQMAQIAG